jgi:hypothetical protein
MLTLLPKVKRLEAGRLSESYIYIVTYLRIECILLKFRWGMKALTEVHFQPRFMLKM